jgi:hypothetical protein
VDEVVIGHWLHAEQMDAGSYSVTLGGRVFSVSVRPDGTARSVTAIDGQPPEQWADETAAEGERRRAAYRAQTTWDVPPEAE